VIQLATDREGTVAIHRECAATIVREGDSATISLLKK